MPATLAGPTQDQWWNAGAKYIRSGVTRGTTTSSGILTVTTGFPRFLHFIEATDEGTHLRVTQTGGGPAQTMSTFYVFNMASVNPSAPTVGRLRVLRFRASGDNNATFTLGSSLSAVTARWVAFGF